jgi:hypothetical protein
MIKRLYWYFGVRIQLYHQHNVMPVLHHDPAEAGFFKHLLTDRNSRLLQAKIYDDPALLLKVDTEPSYETDLVRRLGILRLCTPIFDLTQTSKNQSQVAAKHIDTSLRADMLWKQIACCT